MRVVQVIKYLPLVTTYGQATLSIFPDYKESIKRIENVIENVLNELTLKIEASSEKKQIYGIDLSISQITLGNTIGILIVAWALIE